MYHNLDAPMTEDFTQYRRDMSRHWESFLATGAVPDARVRATILNSWRRCRERGIDPLSFKAPTAPIDGDGVDERLIRVASGVLQSVASSLQLTRHLIAIFDAQGRILEVDGDPQVVARAMDVNIVKGGVWAEDRVGTNGIGTSLTEGRPVQVFATEHFCAGWQDWTCSAAPIRDPVSGATVGGVNISSYRSPDHLHTLGFTTALAQAMEKDLQALALRRRAALLEAFGLYSAGRPSDGVVAIDQDGRLVAANPAARSILAAGEGRRLVAGWAAAAGAAMRHGRPVEQEVQGPGRRRTASLWHPVRVEGMAAGAVGILPLPAPPRAARAPESEWEAWKGAPTRSPRMKQALALARRAAESELPVLILGETGTGKELVARAIHRGSRRNDGPFVAVNCGALAPELVVSELFGYEPGAFTGAARTGSAGKFEQADGGTLFLDEVNDLPPHAQVALLRALEDGEITRVGGRRPLRVDVRVVAATNRDLHALVQDGRFREDLYFRLNAVELVLPPLRERAEDIPLMVAHFLRRAGRPDVRVSEEAMAALRGYRWPGNVRELWNAIRRALLVQQDGVISPRCLPDRIFAPTSPAPVGWDEAKERAVMAAVEKAQGNVAAAARFLGVSRGTVYRYLNRGRSSSPLRSGASSLRGTPGPARTEET